MDHPALNVAHLGSQSTRDNANFNKRAAKWTKKSTAKFMSMTGNVADKY